jgi:hypothetical protein
VVCNGSCTLCIVGNDEPHNAHVIQVAANEHPFPSGTEHVVPADRQRNCLPSYAPPLHSMVSLGIHEVSEINMKLAKQAGR